MSEDWKERERVAVLAAGMLLKGAGVYVEDKDIMYEWWQEGVDTRDHGKLLRLACDHPQWLGRVIARDRYTNGAWERCGDGVLPKLYVEDGESFLLMFHADDGTCRFSTGHVESGRLVVHDQRIHGMDLVACREFWGGDMEGTDGKDRLTDGDP